MYDPRRPAKRSATLLSILDLDTQTQGEFVGGTTILSQTEALRKPHREEREKESIEVFRQFEDDIHGLFQTLLGFHNAARSLGSTASLLKAADILRGDLLMMLELFYDNANQQLNGLAHSSSLLINIRNALAKRQKLEGPTTRKPYASLPTKSISEALNRTANDMGLFLDRINEVCEFAEENMNCQVDRCIGEMRYRASCLEDYEDRMSEPDVALHVNDIAGIIGGQLCAVENALGIFVSTGIPIIREAQEQAGVAFQNLSTVSTLLSAVTATTIQFVYQDHDTGIAYRTNMLWIISLSFSIASAIHSQLAYYWLRHLHRTPSLKMTTGGSILIMRAPLAFFVVATVCFSGGLVAFALMQFGAGTVSSVAIICTSITMGTMLLVVAWLISEKWEHLVLKTAELYRGTRTGVQALFSTAAYYSHILIWWTLGSSVSLWRWCRMTTTCTRTADVEASIPQVHLNGNPAVFEVPPISSQTELQSARPEMRAVSANRAPVVQVHQEAMGPTRLPNSPLTGYVPPIVPDIHIIDSWSAPDEVAGASPLPLLEEWVSPHSLHPQGSPADVTPRLPIPSPRPPAPLGSIPRLESYRLSNIGPSLQHQQMKRCTWKMKQGSSPVLRIAFSPDGQFLASCGGDTGVIIFKIAPDLRSKPQFLGNLLDGGAVKDILWSSDVSCLRFLALGEKMVTLWQIEAPSKCRSLGKITFREDVHCMAWMPNGKRFIAASGNQMFFVDVTEQFEARNAPLPQCIADDSDLGIISMTVLPGAERAWILVDVRRTAVDGHAPLGAPERRLLEVRLRNGQVEDQLPFIHPANHVVASVDGKQCLVTFSNKAPPQLIEKREQRLCSVHSFMPSIPGEIGGRSSMGTVARQGAPDQIVIAASKSGKVCIWDRKSSTILHELETEHEARGLTHAAWNHASTSRLMLATGTQDGHICFWSAPLPELHTTSPK